ncbi:tail fiber domain-containing protein [Candidatus Pacearchaeota archaeon]|nr:tail fiber domain-containing protein [Candidatus Pacearchaeota archaeon]
MIFVHLTDGSNDLYCCDTKSKLIGSEGYEKDGQFYYPALLNQPKFSQKGKNWVSISNVSIQVDRELAQVFTAEEVDVIVWLWDEGSTTSKFKIFEGVGIRGKFDSVQYTYRLEETDHNLKDDLLSLAPDFKLIDSESTTFDEERKYPMYFGYVKQIVPLALAAACVAGCGGTHDSGGGEATALYDGGQDVNYTQSGDTIIKTGASPVYSVTADLDATSASAGSVTTEPTLEIATRTFTETWANRPTTSDTTLYEGDVLYVSDQDNKQYRWDGSTWGAAVSAPDDADNTTTQVNAGVVVENLATDPTYVTIIGGFLLSGSLTQRNGLDSTDIDSSTAVQQTQYIWVSTTWEEVLQLRADGGIKIDDIYAGRGNGRYDTNTALGVVALDSQQFSASGYGNTAIGYKSLRDCTTGTNNTGIGHQSLVLTTTGSQNTAVGYDALPFNTIGYGNTANGTQSLQYNTEGFYVTAQGYASLFNNTTGDYNSALGVFSLVDVTTGNNNTGIGYSAGASSSPFNITTESNRVVVGDNSVTNAYIKVAWTVTSDKRDKTDILKLPIGLDFIMGLKPITYKWDDRSRYKNRKSDGSKKDKDINLGFLAQDVAKLEDKFNMPNDVIANTEQKDKFMLKETAMIPVLVKAIQEQQKQIDELKSMINAK